jgi:peptidyl-prolyl cis-trans isomerase SurA
MLKKIFLIFIFFFSSISISVSNTGFYIVATVNNEIITNHDVKKESEYLKILNPKLNQIENVKIINLAKESLINEIIKKKEIIKYLDFEKENAFISDYLKNFYSKLNFSNEKDFEDVLKKKKNYSLKEVKEKIKIELLWNELIYMRYGNQVKIDKNQLLKKINNFKNKTQKDFMLSEIVFQKKKDENLEKLGSQINSSINEIGFSNTANIYSISQSSKIGGKLGWVNENNLSEILLKKLTSLNIGDHTGIIQIGNNYLILKIDEIRLNEIKINKEKELEKMIKFETNKQLNQYSRIYFDRSRINYSINEN